MVNRINLELDQTLDGLKKMKRDLMMGCPFLSIQRVKEIAAKVGMTGKEWDEIERHLVGDYNAFLGEKALEDAPRCVHCGEIAIPIIENVGYSYPDPNKLETVGHRCPNCGVVDIDQNYQ